MDAPPAYDLEHRIREITLELERQSRALEQSEARFRDVIERNADAIVVVDREGVVRFANAAAAMLFGSGRQHLIGSEFGFPLLAGETTELDLVHDHQSTVLEMRVVESEWEGQPACIATLRDITERKRGEENARRLIREQAARSSAEASARRFRFLAESSTVLSASLEYETTLVTLARLCVQDLADWTAVFIVEEDGTVRRLEVAHRDDAKAGLVSALRDDPLDPEGPHPVLDVLRSRKSILVREVGEDRLRTIAQDARHVELIRQLGVASFMLVPLVARNRSLGAIGLVSADPTRPYDTQDLELAEDLALRAALAIDNARLYREAQEANQAKLDFLAVVSHDLRTPLNSILGHAQLLTMGIPDVLSDASRDRVERIRVGATHLLYLIDQLLAFARLDAGREQLYLQEVAIGDVATEVLSVMEPLAEERGLQLHLDLQHATTCVIDPDKLRQVLLNLVGNAVKYTERGEVRLEVRNGPEGAAVIAVRDTGVGIAKQHLGQIFDPFWQVERTRGRSDGGTGLGLSVVKRLVGMMGGSITVDSTPGKGSVFSVVVPAIPRGSEPVGQGT